MIKGCIPYQASNVPPPTLSNRLNIGHVGIKEAGTCWKTTLGSTENSRRNCERDVSVRSPDVFFFSLP